MDGQTLAAAIAISRGSGGGSFAPDINDPQDGDTLVYDGTEEKWVNGSGGSGGGFLKVGVNPETGALDKTWQQIYDALNAGYFVTVVYPTEDEGGAYQGIIYSAEAQFSGYGVYVYSYRDEMAFNYVATTENDYPVFSS